MKKWLVPVIREEDGEVRVEAETAEEAIDKAMENEGDFFPDSDLFTAVMGEAREDKS